MSDRVGVLIVSTGIANTASVIAAFTRVGVPARPTDSAREVEAAGFLVLPGVGAFGAGMERLRRNDLVAPLQERIAADRPTLCVCLGMQLLCEASEESAGVRGLGIVQGRVTRFAAGPRVPQLGWNRVEVPASSHALRAGSAYFANSYKLESGPPGWVAAITDHGGKFTSAIERGRVLACQFHPELSGQFGLGILRRWLDPSAPTATSQQGRA